MSLSAICVYCGASAGDRPENAIAARELGELLAQRGIALVFGGGHVGLMGTLADAVLALGGRVEGVIPRNLVQRELAHTGTTLHVVESMHERKALMESLSDAFIALPGGIGTLDELFEIWTWAQLGFHHKPLGVLNVNGFWDPLLRLADHLTQAGFLKPQDRALLKAESNPAALIEALEHAR
jgi:uncharacterized protein (TIGR00730 family)